MNINIRVDVNGMYGHYSAAIQVSDYQVRCFEPLMVTDEPLMAYAAGEIMEDSAAAKIIVKTRKDAAKDLAERLAEHIINAMKSRDTKNGYLVDQDQK